MGNKFRILHIIKSLGRGGAEMLLPETLKLHDRSRFEFHYIYFLSWKDQMVDEIRKNGGLVTCVAAANNLQIILKTRTIIQYISKNKIQLVHCHLPWAGIVGRIVHRMINIPVVYTEHNKQERYHNATRWINKLTFNWQNEAIAVSKDVADSIHANITVRIPVSKILNGVNTNYFEREEKAGRALRQKLNIPEDAFVVGTIAVFRFQKRLKEWLEIIASVSLTYPKIYGIMVGAGPLKEELTKHVKKLGLERKIIMPGLQIDIKPWLSAIDVFMMSSIFEGMPVALLEAMSMQCAIATTDAGGIKEVIQHKKNGLIVRTEHWKKLADELVQLLESEDLRSRLGEGARARVKEAFAMEGMVEKLEKLYNSYPSRQD